MLFECHKFPKATDPAADLPAQMRVHLPIRLGHNNQLAVKKEYDTKKVSGMRIMNTL